VSKQIINSTTAIIDTQISKQSVVFKNQKYKCDEVYIDRRNNNVGILRVNTGNKIPTQKHYISNN